MSEIRYETGRRIQPIEFGDLYREYDVFKYRSNIYAVLKNISGATVTSEDGFVLIRDRDTMSFISDPLQGKDRARFVKAIKMGVHTSRGSAVNLLAIVEIDSPQELINGMPRNGIKVGMTVREARLLYKDVVVRDPDPQLVRDVHIKFVKI